MNDDDNKSERFSCSLKLNLIKQITVEAQKRGQSKSYYVTKLLASGLSVDEGLSHAEKYYWMVEMITDRVNNILNTLHIRYTGDIQKTFLLLYSLPSDFFESRQQYNMTRLAVMELLEDLRTVDETLFRRICEALKFQNESKLSDFSEIQNDFVGV